MKGGMRKAIVSHQPMLREMNVSVNGTAGTPEASGLDESQIKEVIDNGAGDYTLVFKYPFNVVNPNPPQVQVTAISAASNVRVVAVAYNMVTIQADADFDFNVRILGSDARLKY